MTDHLIRCITHDGSIMAAAVDSTYIVAAAQQIHHTSPVATAALGRLLSGAALMGSLLKKEGASVTLKVNGGGPLGTLTAIADSAGNCRGFLEHPEVDLPVRETDGKLDVGRAVGSSGLLGVIRDNGEGQPYTGQVELQSGELAEDLSYYFAVSEQIPTICALGVLIDKTDSRRLLAGGLLIQVLPGASEEAIEKLEANAAKLPAVTTMLAHGMSIEEMCRTALQGFEIEILDDTLVYYACPCSRERVLRAFSTLPLEDLLTLPDEATGLAEARCQYCGKVYTFDREELEALAKKLEKFEFTC